MGWTDLTESLNVACEGAFGETATCVPASGAASYTATVVYSSSYTRTAADSAGLIQVQDLGPYIDVRAASCTTAPAQGDVWTLTAKASRGMATDTDLRVTEVKPMDDGSYRLFLCEVVS